jgi:hypothetical protein
VFWVADNLSVVGWSVYLSLQGGAVRARAAAQQNSAAAADGVVSRRRVRGRPQHLQLRCAGERERMILRVDRVGSTREAETPLHSNSPHDQMILRVELVDSHGRWKRPCRQTAHMTK